MILCKPIEELIDDQRTAYGQLVAHALPAQTHLVWIIEVGLLGSHMGRAKSGCIRGLRPDEPVNSGLTC
jgi:hypothetical protein